MAVILFLVADNSAAVIFLAGMIVLPIVTGIMQVLAMRSVTLNCKVKKTSYVKQEQYFEIKLDRANAIPMGALELEAEAENVLYHETRIRRLVLQPVEKKEQFFRYPMDLQDCGELKIRVTKAHFYDLLGLFQIRKELNITSEILVYPPELNLNIQKSRRPEAEAFGELYDPLRKGQDVNEVSGLRGYVDGDSLGSIHWKLSGKLDELIVRELGYPSNYHTVLLCDLMTKIGDHEIEKKQNNAILALTASLSRSMLEANMEHILVKVSEGECQTIPVSTMNDHDAMVLETLCRPMPEKKSGEDSLYYFLRSNLTHLCTKAIYITSHFDSEEARQLSRDLDLTIIHVGMEDQAGYTDMQGYSVLSIRADEYADRLHTIVV